MAAPGSPMASAVASANLMACHTSQANETGPEQAAQAVELAQRATAARAEQARAALSDHSDPAHIASHNSPAADLEHPVVAEVYTVLRFPQYLLKHAIVDLVSKNTGPIAPSKVKRGGKAGVST